MSKKVSDQLSQREYEKLGKLLVSIGEIGYKNKKTLYIAEFTKGVTHGVGAVVGATIVITFVLFLLSAAKEVPFVGDIAESFENTIQSATE